MNTLKQATRFTAVMAGMLLALLLCVFAQPDRAQAATFRYGRSTLTDAQKELYDNIKIEADKIRASDGFFTELYKADEEILIASGPGSLVQADVEHVYEVFAMEEPLYFFLGGNYGWTQAENKTYIGIKPNGYYLDPDLRKKTQAYINHFRDLWMEKVKAVYDDGDSSDDSTADAYEIARLLHDFIIEQTAYDGTNASAYDIGGVFSEGQAVCEGYAKAYKYMLDLAGIDNIFIMGEGTEDGSQWEGHGWNAVKIGGKYYLVDTTWDDLAPDNATYNTPQSYYDYFCLKSSEFNKRHRADSEEDYFKLPTFEDTNEYNYYMKCNSYTGEELTADNAKAFVDNAVESTPGKFVYFAVPSLASVNKIIANGGLDPAPTSNTSISSLFGCLKIWYNAAKDNYDVEEPWEYDSQKEVSVTEPTPCTPSGSSSSSEEEEQEQTGPVTVVGTDAGSATLWLKGNKQNAKATLKTSVRATNYKDAKKKTKKGKVGFVVLTENTGITFDASTHKLSDKSDKSIVTVSNKGVISAKGPGTAYVYAYDTGSFTVERFTVTVLIAPNKLYLTEAAGSKDKADLLKKATVHPGDEQVVYIYEEAKAGNVDATATYKVTLEKGAGSVLTATEVTRDGNGVPYFTLTAKSKPASATKVTKGKVTVVNEQSGKKVSTSIIVDNPVVSLAVTGSGKLEKKKDKVNLTVKFNTPFGQGITTTDGVKVIACDGEPEVNGKKVSFTKSSEIKVKFNKKTGALTLTAGSDISGGGNVYITLKDKGTGLMRVIRVCSVSSSGTVTVG